MVENGTIMKAEMKMDRRGVVSQVLISSFDYGALLAYTLRLLAYALCSSAVVGWDGLPEFDRR
jgi:hypothetical protein